MSDPASSAELAELAGTIERWLDDQLESNPLVVAVERHETDRFRWFVRVAGTEKDFSTIRLHLGQRTLAYETYFCPAPNEANPEFYAFLLRTNANLYGAGFVIGEEEAIFLQGRIDRSLVGDDELDRILGSLYSWIERYFKPALRIGFSSQLNR